MNILHIISNNVWGGGERYALDLCTALKSEGHCVAIACRKRPAVTEPLRQAGFEPATMRLGGVLDIFSPVHLSRMVRRFPGNGCVNIHVHNFKDATLALKVRRLCQGQREVRVVCTRHLVKPGKTSQLPLYRALDRLVFVSERARREFLKGGFPAEGIKMDVISNALPDPGLPMADPAVRPPLILYIGRLSPEKGADVLVEALTRISDLNWRARICGEGEGRYVMPLLRECRVRRLDSRIEWPGHISDVTEEIAAAQIGVVPTKAPEAFGLSIIEMMRQGLPVISSDNGAQPEIITSGRDGLLVPPCDAETLANALRQLIEHADLRCKIGKAGRDRFADSFTYPAFYNAISRIYE
ncbi:MAG: glycosyltransferase family 4 protein [Muribaculaceae bacterium]|nr:glycosyltransferase family 4 protein [Muribaculaceae bacterium]